MIFKKHRKYSDNVLFIDASKNFEKVKNQNILRDSNVDKIIDVYNKREEIEKFSQITNLYEIKENDYNLNIPLYVDTFEEEEPINLGEIVHELKDLDTKVKCIDEEIKKYCDELGIEAPIL